MNKFIFILYIISTMLINKCLKMNVVVLLIFINEISGKDFNSNLRIKQSSMIMIGTFSKCQLYS